MDARVLAFAVAVCACTVLLFGLLPALRATRTDVVTDLKAGGAVVVRRCSSVSGLRELVVAIQLALAVVLLVGCGLLLTSYVRLRETRLGFDPSRLLTFMMRPSEVTTTLPPHRRSSTVFSTKSGACPAWQRSTVDGCAPLSMQCANATLHVVGRRWAKIGGRAHGEAALRRPRSRRDARGSSSCAARADRP